MPIGIYKHRKGYKLSKEHVEKVRLANLGKKRTDLAKQRMSESKLKNPTKYWLGKKRPNLHTEEHKQHLKEQIPWNKDKKFPEYSGINHWNWKNGKSKRMLNTPEYKNWRTLVFQRDNYTCQECGKTNCYLEAHHIKAWVEYPDLRFEVSNGKTLCKSCHKLTRKFYGNKYVKR